MEIEMIHHGGRCCGVTHLYLGGFSKSETKVVASQQFDWDKDGTGIAPTSSVYGGGRPRGYSVTGVFVVPAASLTRDAETAGKRATALLKEHRRTGRNHGIIEVVVTDKQKPGWETWLKDNNFKFGSEATNSNSLNKIYVYLLSY